MDNTYDSSYQAADRLLDRGKFNFAERKLLAKALKKVARRETLVGAMNVVVYNNIEGEAHYSHAKQNIYITQPTTALQGGILHSAAQNAWERQLGQNNSLTSIQRNQMYAQQMGVTKDQYGYYGVNW
jgi:hypothetical protein